MGDLYHVDAQFLRNALSVFEDLREFEARATSNEPAVRAANVARLIDALDLCNLLVLAERVVFDADVGGGRGENVTDQLDRVAQRLTDRRVADEWRAAFAGVRSADAEASRRIELDAARTATAFFPRLARCARNVLDLFHLPHEAPTDPETHLRSYLRAGTAPAASVIEELGTKRGITGRRFYAALLSEPTAFKALCEAQSRLDLTDDVLAVLFMNFRLRLAEQRSLSTDKVVVTGAGEAPVAHALVYLPSMGRRDFSREFSRFVRYGSDPKTRNGHAFDLGLREYVLEEWENVGCQLQLSERRSIPLIVASVLSSDAHWRSRTPETLLTECLRWRRDQTRQIEQIRTATRQFEALEDDDRREKASAFVAEILKSPSTTAARNTALAHRLSMKDGWLGFGIRAMLSPGGALSDLAIKSTDKVRQHFEHVSSHEYAVATNLSEAARPVLAGVGSDIRQRLIDVFGGTVIDARNPQFDPDRFAASA